MRCTVEPIGVIDIGSNTVLMTCGKIENGGKLEVLLESHDVARLSEGLQDGKPLRPEAKDRVLHILSQFKDEARRCGVNKLIAAGTAAFRRAADGVDFAERILRETGIPVRILTGREEAHL